LLRHYDVAVIGLGINGSACVAALSERGRHVLGLERSVRGRPDGASGGGSKLLREFHPDHPRLVRAATTARSRWLDRSAQTGRTLFIRTGGVAVGPAGDPAWRRQVTAAEAAVSSARVISRDALVDMVPWVSAPSDALAIYEPDAGILLASAAVDSLQEVACASGADLEFDTYGELDRPHDVDADRPVRVRVNESVVTAEHVIFCTGPWTPRLSVAQRVPPMRVERAVVHWTTSDRARVVGQSAPFVAFSFSGEQFCVVPWLDDHGVRFGRFGTGRTVTAEAFGGAVLRAEVDADREILGRFAPILRAVDRVTSNVCVHSHPTTEAFFLRYVGPRVAVVSACAGRGFKFAPLVADAVAESILRSRHHGGGILHVSHWPSVAQTRR
jgi:sarcosine oxidase